MQAATFPTKLPDGEIAPGVDVRGVLNDAPWWRVSSPFEHYVARNVFSRAFHLELEHAFRTRLARGLSDRPDCERFSRNMSHSDAFGWNFPPDIDGPLAVFYSREWHRLLTRLTGTVTTMDVNAALHHHHVGSIDGTVHRDLTIVWFSQQPRPDGINPMDLSRCGYTRGERAAGVEAVERVRCITMIYFLCNPPISARGGETGLYASASTPVDRPARRISPESNSILVFKNSIASWHAFLSNMQHPRNSVILWLHTTAEASRAQVGSAARCFR